MKNVVLAVGAAVALAVVGTAGAAPNFPVGTHVVKGSVRGYD